jgi:uncharacterized protein
MPLPLSPDFDRARAYAQHRLEHDLPSYFTYHSIWHTRDEVAPMADRLAEMEGIMGEERVLLNTAAWYHDVGCVVQRQDHEAVGVGLAAAVLPNYGYTPDHIQVIANIIMATKLPQTPRTHLERIIADADLDVLGREDFAARNIVLRAELAHLGLTFTDEGWWRNQLEFLQKHQYFTDSARHLRDAQKVRNMAYLQQLLA